MNEIKLRDYQAGAVSELRQEYATGRQSPLLVLPTGGGKTFVFSYITANANKRGNKVVILVHRQELLTQSSDSLAALHVEHGCIAPGRPLELTKATQVASVQTLVRRFHQLDAANWKPDLIVIDEAHHATAGSWRKVLDYWPGAKVLGVTATPCRMDGSGLGIDAGGVFDSLVIGPQIYELIEGGHLAPPIVYAPPVVADLTGIRTSLGDFSKGEAAERMDKPTVTGDAVAHYSKLCPGVPAICFCVSVAHAEHVAEQFNQAGWKAASLGGGMLDTDRKARIRDLAENRLHVLTSCDIISEGTDIPVVGAAILLRPTKSLGLYLQQVGRALRLYPGKTHAIILDHVGNVATHGLPDDHREWALEGTKGKSRGANDNGPPPPLTCEGCFNQIRRPAPDCCPMCGKSLKAEKDRMDRLQHEAGELQRLDESAREQLAERRRMLQEQAMAGSMGELVAIAVKRGYKNPQQWAWKVWSNRTQKRRAG